MASEKPDPGTTFPEGYSRDDEPEKKAEGLDWNMLIVMAMLCSTFLATVYMVNR
jgi:hypothetical protein